MDFNTFIKETQCLAKKLINSEEPDEIKYLQEVEAMLRTVTELTEFDLEDAEVKKRGNGWFWSTVANAMPIYGIKLNLLKGGFLSPHDHDGYIGLVYVLKGRVRIITYSQISKGANLTFKKIEDNILTPGDCSYVLMESENVHEIHDVSGGSEVLDLLTIFHGNGESKEIALKEIPNKDRLYQGTFTGAKP